MLGAQPRPASSYVLHKDFRSEKDSNIKCLDDLLLLLLLYTTSFIFIFNEAYNGSVEPNPKLVDGWETGALSFTSSTGVRALHIFSSVFSLERKKEKQQQKNRRKCFLSYPSFLVVYLTYTPSTRSVSLGAWSLPGSATCKKEHKEKSRPTRELLSMAPGVRTIPFRVSIIISFFLPILPPRWHPRLFTHTHTPSVPSLFFFCCCSWMITSTPTDWQVVRYQTIAGHITQRAKGGLRFYCSVFLINDSQTSESTTEIETFQLKSKNKFPWKRKTNEKGCTFNWTGARDA